MVESTEMEMHARVSKPVFLGIIWAFTALSFIFVSFRISVRVTQFRRLFIDDYLVLLAWMLMLATAISWQIEAQFLYRLYAISAGTATLPPDFVAKYNTLMNFIAPWTIMFYSGLWCIKFSFLAFFLRLGSRVKAHRIWWYIVLGATIAVYIASIADIDYQCSFGGMEFIIEKCSQLDHIRFEYRTFWANCAGDIVTDILILSIPFLMLWNTRVPFRNKVILFCVFSATIIVMVVAILRVVENNHAGTKKSADISWLYLWSTTELGTAIIIACVASFRQLFVTSQNQHLYGRAANQYQPYNPLLDSKSRRLDQTSFGSKSDVESRNHESPVLPLDLVHVRSEFQVTTA